MLKIPFAINDDQFTRDDADDSIVLEADQPTGFDDDRFIHG
jgi:hypothetical protein